MTIRSGAPAELPPVPAPSTEPTDFDFGAPLPTGTTVLEASAGTGKTYTIAALAARYVAEDVATLDQLLLVTFGRYATTELRSRVHERLVSTEGALAAVIGGEPYVPSDEVERLVLAADPVELEARHRRIARALADFDAATIATTHEFCLRMLDGLGVLGDREPDTVVVEEVDRLTREVATDLYLSRYAARGHAPMTLEEALAIASAAVAAVHARVVPAPAASSGSESEQDDDAIGDADDRVAYAAAVRAEVDRRKRAGRVVTFDDMLTRLQAAVTDPGHGEVAAQRLRDLYRVVLVDEFQDTDPIQWDIIRQAFHGHTTLILIGDPKQAIYAFRGADVYSYLDAVRQADRVLTLGTNWRSDAGLVEALDGLLGGAALGEDEIRVRGVRASHLSRRLIVPPTVDRSEEVDRAAPVRLRVRPHEIDAERVPGVAALRPEIERDLVAEVTALLSSGAQIRTDGRQRAVEPADIAVLVRTNARGESIRAALVATGVPAVVHGSSSVFESPIAGDWLTLLEALEQPQQAAVRRAALTCFFGWSVADLAAADEERMIDLSQQVRSWSRVLAARGVAALLEAATTQQRVPERLLARVGGDRELTDLRHVAQSLHAAATTGQLGVHALVEWLAERIAEARSGSYGEGTRRLETDAKAVSILTVHRSKGLEFPIVCLPDAWDRYVADQDKGQVLRLHEPGGEPGRATGDCVIDVGGRNGVGRSARYARHWAEDDGESLRLLYVALTRAQCQLLVWWAPSVNTSHSPLQRLLYRGSAEGGQVPRSYRLQGDPLSIPPIAGWSIEPIRPRAIGRWQRPAEQSPALAARYFDRDIDLAWRRTSYSALTAAAHGVGAVEPTVGSEPEVRKEDDEAGVLGAAAELQLAADGPAAELDRSAAQFPAAEPSPMDQLSPMAGLPMGAEFGSAVHAVFEQVDPAAPELADRLRSTAAAVLGQLPHADLTGDQLAAALLPAFRTPLGPLAGGRTLADIAATDRLAELAFELPLGGGSATSRVVLGDLSPLLRRRLPATDPLAGYADQIAHPALAEQPLHGYLNGSIDAVLRLRDGEAVRYLVVDYKTNWLGDFDGRPLTVGDYRPARMAAAMLQAHYPLQALLYSVAVHRMLRWRQPGYDPEVHLGGVLYLFVRGMAGPATPVVDDTPCGVFSWRPPTILVTELSDLLDGRVAR